MGKAHEVAKTASRTKTHEFPATHDKTALAQVKDRFARCEHVLNTLHSSGDDPLLLLWRIAQTNDIEPRLRVECAKEVASYLHSKQTNVKVSGGDQPIRFSVSWEQAPNDAHGQPVIEASHKRVYLNADDAELVEDV